MGRIGKAITGTVAVVALVAGLGWLGLALATREPARPVVTLPAAGPLLLTGVTVVDPRDGSKSANMTVLMDKGLIVSVAPAGMIPAPPGGQIVNAPGQYLVPGYNDMHAHPLANDAPAGDLALMLANGVTGFRQMSGSDSLLKQRAEHRLPITENAPDVLLLPGALLTPLNASRPDQARETVRAQQAAGADFIKIGLVSEPVLFAALDEARRIGIPVAGHVPAGTDIVVAAQRGMHAIEHLGPANALLIACSAQADALRAEVKADTKIPVLPAIKSHIVERLADRLLARVVINPAAAGHDSGTIAVLKAMHGDIDEPACRQTMRALKAAGNWQIPTLIRRLTTMAADDPAWARDPHLAYLPAATVTSWKKATQRFIRLYPANERALLHQGQALYRQLVKMLDEEGVEMLAGSDASGAGWEVPGFALHQEFDELAKAGLSPLRILQMTTSDAARFLDRADMGAIAPNMVASAVLLDADPTADAANLHHITAVIHRGVFHDRQSLDRLLQSASGNRR